LKRAPDDYYAGVNAAARSVLLGTAEDLALAEAYARRVQKIVGTEPRIGDYWMTVTVAEVALISRDYQTAARLYEAGVAMAQSEVGSHKTVWKQACRFLANLKATPKERALIRAAFAHLQECEQFVNEPN
jgi:hypothetical protein